MVRNKMENIDVVVLGSANVDLTLSLPKIPREGETVSDGRIYFSCGGKGLNQSVASNLAGSKTLFIGKIGKDDNGQLIKNAIKKMGLKSLLFQDDKVNTGCAFIFVDSDGRNAIGVSPGANKCFTEKELRKIKETLLRLKAKYFLSQLEIPVDTVIFFFKIAKELGGVNILNPAPQQKIPDILIKLSDFFIPNSKEASFYSGIKVEDKDSGFRAAEKLNHAGVKNVIITLGENGSIFSSKYERKYVPAFKVKPVDTTSAGDVFLGYFTSMLTRKNNVEESMIYASAASAVCVSKRGALPSIPKRKEVDRFLKRARQ